MSDVSAGVGTPELDPVDEARRLLSGFAEVDVPVVLIGGAAVRMACVSATTEPLRRPIGDIDFISGHGLEGRITGVLDANGYAPHREVNLVQGHRRLLYFDRKTGRKLDFFVGSFRMCHEFAIRGLPTGVADLSSLLMTKLQIVRLNEKDVKDILALFNDHSFGESQDEISLMHVLETVSVDWGIFTTFSDSLVTAEQHAERLDVPAAAERIHHLREQMELVDKSRKWRMRARIGRRKRWYQLPEDLEEEVESPRVGQ